MHSSVVWKMTRMHEHYQGYNMLKMEVSAFSTILPRHMTCHRFDCATATPSSLKYVYPCAGSFIS